MIFDRVDLRVLRLLLFSKCFLIKIRTSRFLAILMLKFRILKCGEYSMGNDNKENKYDDNDNISVDEKDFYKILNVSSNASIEEIKKSYRKLALKYHPDKKPHGNEEIFKKINEAYCVLSNNDLRGKYDFSSIHEKGHFTESNDFKDHFNNRFFEGEFLRVFSTSFSNLLLFNKKTNIDYYNLETGQVFYIVGDHPIQIKKKKFSINNLFGRLDSKSELRNDLSSQEIKNSFPLTGEVMLFRNRASAFDYSDSKRIGNFYKNSSCLQLPIFKVFYNFDLEQLKIEEKYIKFKDRSNFSSFSTRLKFCVTPACNVTPLIGYLDVGFIENAFPEVVMTEQIMHENVKILKIG